MVRLGLLCSEECVSSKAVNLVGGRGDVRQKFVSFHCLVSRRGLGPSGGPFGESRKRDSHQGDTDASGGQRGGVVRGVMITGGVGSCGHNCEDEE